MKQHTLNWPGKLHACKECHNFGQPTMITAQPVVAIISTTFSIIKLKIKLNEME